MTPFCISAELRRAMELNNVAVGLIDLHLPQAVAAFQLGISSARLTTTADLELCQGTNLNTRNSTEADRSSSWSLVSPTRALGVFQSDHLYVHNRPFLISTSQSGPSSFAEPSLTIITSTILMFNYALTCHHIAKITGQSHPLRRARQLYNLVLHCLTSQLLIHSEEPSQPDHKDGVIGCDIASISFVLQVLVLNNLVYLQYFEFSEYQEGCRLTDQLLVLTANSSINFLLQAYLGSEQVEQLKLGWIYLQPPSTALAA